MKRALIYSLRLIDRSKARKSAIYKSVGRSIPRRAKGEQHLVRAKLDPNQHEYVAGDVIVRSAISSRSGDIKSPTGAWMVVSAGKRFRISDPEHGFLEARQVLGLREASPQEASRQVEANADAHEKTMDWMMNS